MKKKIQNGVSILVMLILLFTVIPMGVMAEEQTVNSNNQTVTVATTVPNCTYRTHVENIGWQNWKTSGTISGTSGQGLRLEGIEIKLDNQGYALGVEYSTHIQNIGWQDFKSNGTMSGTSGKGLRLEAIMINLTGNDAELFDIYYHVHAQNIGWMGWAKNSETAGTAGYGYRLEGIEIKVVPKGDPAPSNNVVYADPFKENNEAPYNTILQEYRTAEANNFSSDLIWNSLKNVNTEIVSNRGKLYYMLEDISGDSIPELVIASYSTQYGYHIYDMYKLVGNQPERIFDVYSMGYRINYTICENQMIKCLGSGGAKSYGYTFYKLDGNTATTCQEIMYDGWNGPKYYLTDPQNIKRQIPEVDAKKIINSYTPKNDINWIKL